MLDVRHGSLLTPANVQALHKEKILQSDGRDLKTPSERGLWLSRSPTGKKVKAASGSSLRTRDSVRELMRWIGARATGKTNPGQGLEDAVSSLGD